MTASENTTRKAGTRFSADADKQIKGTDDQSAALGAIFL